MRTSSFTHSRCATANPLPHSRTWKWPRSHAKISIPCSARASSAPFEPRHPCVNGVVLRPHWLRLLIGLSVAVGACVPRSFPESKRKVKEAAVNIGVRRAMVVVADYIKVQQSRDLTFGGSMKVPDKLKKRMKQSGCRASTVGGKRNTKTTPDEPEEPAAPALNSGAENVLKAAMQQEERSYQISSQQQGAPQQVPAPSGGGRRMSRMSLGMGGCGVMPPGHLMAAGVSGAAGMNGTPRAAEVQSQMMALVRCCEPQTSRSASC